MRPKFRAVATSAALLLAVLPLIAAHGDDMDMSMGAAGKEMLSGPTNITVTEAPAAATTTEVPLTYLRHPSQTGWMWAHIGLMIMGWMMVLPPAIMLSSARSRYSLPTQILFHIVNGLGMFTGFVYRHSTPNLYPHNSHIPIGWIATSFTVVWTLASLVVAYSDFKSSSKQVTRDNGSRAQNSLSSRAMAQYGHMQPYRDRFSGDSGHGSSLLGGSSRQNSADSIYQTKPEVDPLSPASDDYDEENDNTTTNSERRGFLGHNRVDRYLSSRVSRFASQRLTRVVRFTQILLEKLVLLIGFIALTTGIVVWLGLFMRREIFSGLAHWIKGGIFFWYGLLTLGRWMGAFAEFGWAWNRRPLQSPAVARWKTRVPSAEFVESFVIWFYGVSNVGLEHLNNWGAGWSAQDLEHVSITLLFFGGGLLGMLIEARWVRELLDTSVVAQQQQAEHSADRQAEAEAGALSPTALPPPAATNNNLSSGLQSSESATSPWNRHPTSATPLNPLPALTILLLGIMMSSHHQASMTSTMLHGQWGTLFMGFAFSRAATYLLMWLRPPIQHFASRPPTEIVSAFCLVSGGILFMASARDCVTGMEAWGVEAMPVFTVVVGITGCLLAWEVVCFAIKGWAVRREGLAAGA